MARTRCSPWGRWVLAGVGAGDGARRHRDVATGSAHAVERPFVIGEVALERATRLQLLQVAFEALDEAADVVARTRRDQPRAARERVAHLGAHLAPGLLDAVAGRVVLAPFRVG